MKSLIFIKVFLKYKLLLFLLFILPLRTFPQKSNIQAGLSPDKDVIQFTCDTWQKKQGLKQNTVNKVIQAQNGFLWLATSEGLIRFDGLSFKVFNTSNVKLLSTSNILNVYEDSKQRLWIATNGGGLLSFEQDKFKLYTTKDGLASDIITAVIEDQNKNIWVGTNKGLSKIQQDKVLSYGAKDGLPSANITAFFLGKEGTLWVGTRRGVASVKNEKIEDQSRNLLLINRYVTSILEDHLGNLWIGTHGGLVRWNKKNDIYAFFKNKSDLRDDYITALFLDHYGTLWIGTHSAGLYRLTKLDMSQEKPHFSNLTTQHGLTANSILDIYEDYEGSLWLGMDRGGLNRLRESKFDNYSKQQGLKDDFVNCVYKDSEGILWLGTVNGGLSAFENGGVKNYTTENGLANNHIRSITEDKKSNLWLGTYGSGIIKFDKKNENISKIYTTSNGLAGDIVRCIIQAKDTSFWIATKTGLSHLKKDEFTNFGSRDGLSSDAISIVFEDSKGNLWVGTDHNGLDLLKAGKAVKHYNTSNGLLNNDILSIYEDKTGNIWIGTKSGLSLVVNGKVKTISTKEGLTSEAIHSITEDTKGKMWFSSNNGIYWLFTKDLLAAFEDKTVSLKPIAYHEEEGMRSSDCSLMAFPVVVKDKTGSFWYPTNKGVSVINPNEISKNPLAPKVVISNIIVDGKKVVSGKKLNFPAGTNRIEFDFVALSFIAPSKLKYKYRLKGFEDKWVDFGNKSDVFYTNLPPGNYTFQVIASNSDGVWNEEGDQQSFYIKPYFYQTTWFLIFVVLSIIAIVVVLYYWRTSTLRKRAKVLEQKIEERTKEIREQAEEISTIDRIVQVINQEFEIEKVLSTILEQSLQFVPSAKKGLFFDFINRKQRFEVLANIGYNPKIFKDIFFFPNDIIGYYKDGEEIEEGIFKIYPKKDGLDLMSDYQPTSTIAVSINVKDRVEGIMFLDNADQKIEFDQKDLRQLKRLKQHAISAFAKAQTLSEIEQKNVEIGNNLRKVSDSIKYAHRIQKAILGNPDNILGYFSDAFIHYVPKDIVSGDFYWFTETEPQPIIVEKILDKAKGVERVMDGFTNFKEVLVAADCTGHGVPGGFMTVIGHDLLDRIVREKHITDAAQILYELDNGIKEYLRQDQEKRSNEGMDMSLLVIDRDENTIEFAGAKNPLVRIRDGELTTIKGSKYPIGGTQIKNKKFDKHVLDFREGDLYYMFSDGFQDQFGGEDNRKFSIRRLRQLLFDNHQESMKKQKRELRRTFDKWIRDYKQTDDILVIGIKL